MYQRKCQNTVAQCSPTYDYAMFWTLYFLADWIVSKDSHVMDSEVLEVIIKGVLPTHSGSAVFLGNSEKTFVIYVDQGMAMWFRWVWKVSVKIGP